MSQKSEIWIVGNDYGDVNHRSIDIQQELFAKCRIYAGTSPTTGGHLIVKYADELGGKLVSAKIAAVIAQQAGAPWRLASKEEMASIFQNKNQGMLCGTFSDSSSYHTAPAVVREPKGKLSRVRLIADFVPSHVQKVEF